MNKFTLHYEDKLITANKSKNYKNYNILNDDEGKLL